MVNIRDLKFQCITVLNSDILGHFQKLVDTLFSDP